MGNSLPNINEASFHKVLCSSVFENLNFFDTLRNFLLGAFVLDSEDLSWYTYAFSFSQQMTLQ